MFMTLDSRNYLLSQGSSHNVAATNVAIQKGESRNGLHSTSNVQECGSGYVEQLRASCLRMSTEMSSLARSRITIGGSFGGRPGTQGHFESTVHRTGGRERRPRTVCAEGTGMDLDG